MEELLNFTEYCSYLHIGKSTGYKLLISGKIHGIKIGRKWVVPRESIEAYLKLADTKNE